MIDGLKRGKWVAGRTVGVVLRANPLPAGGRVAELQALSDEVERCANQAVDEAVRAALEAAHAAAIERGAVEVASAISDLIEARP